MEGSIMIKSVYSNQTELLQALIELYGITSFSLDPTYSKGNFYKGIPEPKYKSDICPQMADVHKHDCRELPFGDKSFSSIMFDPPFLATKGPSLAIADDSNLIAKRFSVFPTEPELHQFFYDSLKEFYRLLEPGGFLVFKIQDKVSSGKQYMTHVYTHNMAVKLGFYPKDLFILVAASRIVSNWQRKQQHARKFHSYFWVFQKIKHKINFDTLWKEEVL